MEDLIERLFAAAERQRLELYGVHVYRNGGDPVERRFRSDDRVNLYSVAKTFVSVALGIAEAEGRLSLDDAAIGYLPALRRAAAPGTEKITIRHLVTMTSGSPHVWFADQRIMSGDLAADFFATPLEHEPGTRFRYTGTGHTSRLGRCAPRPVPTCGTIWCPVCSSPSTCTTPNGTPAR